MFRNALYIKPQNIFSSAIRQTRFDSKQVVRDPTNKTENEKLAWSSKETDTSTLERDKNRLNYPFKNEDGSISYYGFTYFPRFPDQEDPPIKPSPLFMVKKIPRKITFGGVPKWQREALEKLGFDKKWSKLSQVVIVKNIPEVNEMLYVVKNLIKITPIQLPEDLPEDADPSCCFLKENGEFVYNKALKIDEEKLKLLPNYHKHHWDWEFVQKDSRKTWDDAYNLKLA